MKRWISLVLAMVLLGTACACSGQSKTDIPAQEQDTSQTAPPLLPVDLATLLTPDQIGDAIGDTVGAPQMYESNTWAHYTGVHSATTVDISLDETSREVFNARADLYPDKVEAPFLGDVSWWDTATGELLTYGDGYTVSVRVVFGGEADEDMRLMATRHVTALLLDSAAK